MDPRPPASALREIVAVGLFGVPRPMSRAVPILVAHLHGQAKTTCVKANLKKASLKGANLKGANLLKPI